MKVETKQHMGGTEMTLHVQKNDCPVSQLKLIKVVGRLFIGSGENGTPAFDHQEAGELAAILLHFAETGELKGVGEDG